MSTLLIEWPMVAVGLWYGQAYVMNNDTQVHFIDGILNAQRYSDEILRHIVVPFSHDHHLMLQHDNAMPALSVHRISTQFLEAENIPVLAWPAYSPNMSPIEHVWDALDRRKRQRVPVPANIPQLCTAIEQEWTNIPQATINNLINSMRRRCVALLEANGGHSRYSGAREGDLCRGCCLGGGVCSQFLHINITPNRNRKLCYSLRTFMRSC